MKSWLNYGRVAGLVGGLLLLGGLAYANSQGNLNFRVYPAVAGGLYAEPITYKDGQTLVPPDELVEGSRNAESVPTLVNPKMINIDQVTADYFDSIEGLVLNVAGRSRFYSFQILNWHEVIQDTIDGQQYLITQSTLCGASAIYKAEGKFELSGQLYNNCSLLKDEVGNLWLQPLGVQVVGQNVGVTWERVESRVMTFEDWYTENPDGLVLSLDTGVERIYGRHPFGNYDTAQTLYYPVNHRRDDLSVKDWSWDVLVAGERAGFAVSRQLLAQANGVLTFTFKDQPYLALMNNARAEARVYSAKVGDQVLSFSRDTGSLNYVDAAGTIWNADGLAISGSMKGEQLTEISTNRLFTFALVALAPDTIFVAPASPEAN